MVGKKSNVLRRYHLLVARLPDGYSWQIRYGRRAGVMQESGELFTTQEEAAAAGERALADLSARGDDGSSI